MYDQDCTAGKRFACLNDDPINYDNFSYLEKKIFLFLNYISNSYQNLILQEKLE